MISERRFNPLGATLDAGLSTLIEAALPPLLATDPVSLRRLAALEGKQLQLELSAPALTLVVRPHAEGISLGGRLDGEADARVSASLSALLQRLNNDAELAGEGVEVSGDTALVAELRSLVRDLDIDWEGLLGDQIGDLLAHPLAEAVRGGQRWLANSRHSLLQDLDNYLHEELAVLPARPQLEQYYRGVDELRLAVDRLQARLDQLQNKTDP